MGLEDQWADLEGQWADPEGQWVDLEDLWEVLEDPWVALEDPWAAQEDPWADQWDLVDLPQECQVALEVPCPCPLTRSIHQTSQRCSTHRTPTHHPSTPVASVTRKCTTMTR